MYSHKNSLGYLLAYSLLLFIITLLFRHYAPEQMVSNLILFMVPFFLLISVGTRSLLKTIKNKDDNRVTQYFFLISSGKFFLYLMIMVVYGFSNREDAIAFILTFFVFYILYTLFDIRAMLKINSK